MQSKTTSEETLRVDLPQYTCDSLREASKNLFASQAWLGEQIPKLFSPSQLP